MTNVRKVLFYYERKPQGNCYFFSEETKVDDKSLLLRWKEFFFGFHVITHLNDFMKSITSGKTILCLEAYGDIKLISHSFHHAFELKFFAHLKKCWMPIKVTYKTLLKCFVNGRINHCKIINLFTKCVLKWQFTIQLFYFSLTSIASIWLFEWLIRILL